MIFPWFFNGLSWSFYGLSMVFPWYFHGISMVFLWSFHGLSMVFPWSSMVFPWSFHGISMVFLWSFHCLSMVFPWSFHGLSMVFLWSFHCLPMVFLHILNIIYILKTMYQLFIFLKLFKNAWTLLYCKGHLSFTLAMWLELSCHRGHSLQSCQKVLIQKYCQ